jgi:hypothetical protein
MHHQDFLFPITQGEGRRRVALREELPEVFKSLFTGFAAFRLPPCEGS